MWCERQFQPAFLTGPVNGRARARGRIVGRRASSLQPPPSLGIHSTIDDGSMSAKKTDGGSQLQIDLFAVPLTTHRQQGGRLKECRRAPTDKTVLSEWRCGEISKRTIDWGVRL